MNQIQENLLHDLRKIALIINQLDGAVGDLISDLDGVIKGEPDGIRSKGTGSCDERDIKSSR